jgi:hypothetical protein
MRYGEHASGLLGLHVNLVRCRCGFGQVKRYTAQLNHQLSHFRLVFRFIVIRWAMSTFWWRGYFIKGILIATVPLRAGQGRERGEVDAGGPGCARPVRRAGYRRRRYSAGRRKQDQEAGRAAGHRSVKAVDVMGGFMEMQKNGIFHVKDPFLSMPLR